MKSIMRIAVIPLLVVATPTASSHEACAKTECATSQSEIRTIEAKMRSGYSHADKRYERRLRELRDKRYQCAAESLNTLVNSALGFDHVEQRFAA